MLQPEFEQIYSENKEKVWKIIARFVFSRADREDLFQEVFLKVHAALPRFRGEAKLETWLYRIAVNTSINYVNKQNRDRKLQKLLENLRIVEEIRPVEVEDLSLPLAKLNPQQRMVLLLVEVEEKSLEEVTEIMRLPLGTIKSNLHRAKGIIKKEVIKDGSICVLYPEIKTNPAEN